MENCSWKKKDGTPCGAYRVEGSKFCFMHSPTLARERSDARRPGGHHRKREANPIPFPDANVMDLEGLTKFTAAAICQTWELPNSVARSRALCQLVAVQKDLLEATQIARRVNATARALTVREARPE